MKTHAWLLAAYTSAASSMVASQVRGELALMRLITTVSFAMRSPNTILAMSTVSWARSPAVTEPMKGLSEKRRWAATMSK